MELFDFQGRVVDEVRDAIRSGARSILIVAPTGSGKTVMGAHIIHSAEQRGNRSLFTAHRRELVNQTADKLQRFGVDHGIVMAGQRPKTWYSTQVASIDTIRARSMNPKRKIQQPLPDASILMVDEAHRSCSPTYTKLIDHYRDDAIVIGLTATPIRGDGKGLGRHYDEMVLAPTMQELIDMGRLVPPRYFVPSIPDLTGVPIDPKKHDYVEKHLGKVMGTEELIGDVVEHYKKLAYGRPAILFAPDVKSSIGHMQGLNEAGIPAAHIDAGTSIEEREEIIEGLATGRYMVVCNCMVLTEGFDCPPVSCIILCRPTRNLGLYIQMGGRGARTYEGKDDFIVIDHSGSFYEHGYLEDEHDWRLTDGDACESREERQKNLDEKKPITCSECAHTYTGQLICPNCGHEPKRSGKRIESRAADLVEIRSRDRAKKAEREDRKKKREYTHDEKQFWYSQLLQIARDRGNKEGSVAHKFKAKFGVWPRNMEQIPTEPTPEVIQFVRHLDIRYAKSRQRNAA